MISSTVDVNGTEISTAGNVADGGATVVVVVDVVGAVDVVVLGAVVDVVVVVDALVVLGAVVVGARELVVDSDVATDSVVVEGASANSLVEDVAWLEVGSIGLVVVGDADEHAPNMNAVPRRVRRRSRLATNRSRWLIGDRS